MIMKEGVVFLEKTVWFNLRTADKKKSLSAICEMMAHAEVYTNIEKKTLLDDADLFQTYNDNGERFSFVTDPIELDCINLIEIGSLSSVYLVNKDNAFCEKARGELGVTILNDDNINSNHNLFENREKWIGKDEIHAEGWQSDDFKDIFENKWCNSMVVIDKYICKVGNADRLNPNLIKLFNALLPKTPLTLPFHLSIICKMLDQRNGSNLFNDIKKSVEEIRPDLKISLTLYHSHEIHDRVIVTNTYMVKIGAGFALFNKGRAYNETNLELFYPMLLGKKQEYYKRLARANNVHIKSYSNNNLQSFWGSNENRLFDLVN